MSSGGGNSEPRVLLIDCENTPYTVFTWDNNPRTPISHANIVKSAELLSLAWMWEGENVVHSIMAPPGGGDYAVARKAQELINQADAVVAHFGDGHDIPWIAGRCLKHGLGPLRQVIQIDTWKIARSKFKLYNNKLAYLAEFLGLPINKIDTDFQLWIDCMAGNKEARRKMLLYNEQDVRVLESVWKKVRHFAPAKLNRVQFVPEEERGETCPHCGERKLLKQEPKKRTRTREYDEYRCGACRGFCFKVNDLPR